MDICLGNRLFNKLLNWDVSNVTNDHVSEQPLTKILEIGM